MRTLFDRHKHEKDPRNKLIVGCSHDHQHQFSLGNNNTISSEDLHPKEFYIHLSKHPGLYNEGAVDIEGDFLDERIQHKLSQKAYSLIAFEATTELFSSNEDLSAAVQKSEELLSKDGVLFIYNSYSTAINLLKQQFNYVWSASYGYRADKCSIIATNGKLDIIDFIKNDIYLNYMFEHVIAKKFNVSSNSYLRDSHHNQNIFSIPTSHVEERSIAPSIRKGYGTF